MSCPFKFKPGDVCLTQNTRVGLLNNGIVVRVLRINPGKVDHLGAPYPYVIERVDGRAFPSIRSVSDGTLSWYKLREVHCAEYKLSRCDPEGPSTPMNTEVESEDEATV